MKESIDFFKFVSIIRKKWLLVALATLVGFTLSYVITNFIISPQYSSVTRIIVSVITSEMRMLSLEISRQTSS